MKEQSCYIIISKREESYVFGGIRVFIDAKVPEQVENFRLSLCNVVKDLELYKRKPEDLNKEIKYGAVSKYAFAKDFRRHRDLKIIDGHDEITFIYCRTFDNLLTTFKNTMYSILYTHGNTSENKYHLVKTFTDIVDKHFPVSIMQHRDELTEDEIKYGI